MPRAARPGRRITPGRGATMASGATTEAQNVSPGMGIPPEAMPPDDSQLVESDGVPIDSPWHRAAIGLLIDSLTEHWRDRDDFYVGGDMFLYFSAEQVRNRDFRGPDF